MNKGHRKYYLLLSLLYIVIRLHAGPFDNEDSKELQFAVIQAPKEVVHSLLKRSSDVEVNKSYPGGWTLLHAAVARGEQEVVELLIDYGADKKIKNKQGINALMLAQALSKKYPNDYKYRGIVKLLKNTKTSGKARAKVMHLLDDLDEGVEQLEADIGKQLEEVEALVSGCRDIGLMIEKLLGNNDPSSLNAHYSSIPSLPNEDKEAGYLEQGLYYFSPDTSKDPSKSEVDSSHLSSIKTTERVRTRTELIEKESDKLLIAARDGDVGQLQELLNNYGFNPNLVGHEGRTPLYLAITNAPTLADVSPAFFSRHIRLDSNLVAEHDIYSVVLAKYLKIVKSLLEKGADARHMPEVWGDKRRAVKHPASGLALAVIRDQPEIAKLLLEFGLDPNEKGPYGETLLQLVDRFSSAHNKSEMARLLQGHQARNKKCIIM